MALPLPDLTFYRMPLQTVAVASATGFLDALYAGLSSATDYKGTALAASHTWTFAKDGATNAVYTTAVPAGSPMTFTPGLIWALNPGAVPPIQAGDTASVGAFYAGICKSPGAWIAYNNATPYTTAWYGYASWGPSTFAALTTTVQAYISQETIIVETWVSSTAGYLAIMGALIEPYTDSAGVTCETDSRLYGLITSGRSSGGVSTTAISATGTFDHNTTDGQPHARVYIPGSLNTVYECGRDRLSLTANLQQQDMANTYISRELTYARNSASLTANGAALGKLRGIGAMGLLQSNLTRRNGGVDLFHVIGAYNAATEDAFAVKAVA